MLKTIIIVVCVIVSFLLSGMEAGVLALSRLRIRQMMRAGNESARQLLGYLDKPENFLWTILVGNTLTNLLAISLMVWLLYGWMMGVPALLFLSFGIMVFLFYAFCELLPKMLFRLFPNRLTMMLAGPFRFIHFVLSPMVALVTWISHFLLGLSGGKTFKGLMFGSREEMRLVMQESSQGLTGEERQMINRVLDLQTLRLRDLVIPMDKVVGVSVDATVEEALRLSTEHKISRLPVWRNESGRRKIVGIFSLRTWVYQGELDRQRPAGEHVKPALYLDEDTRVEVALKRMQRSGQRLGIVLGPDQKEVGIISLLDILKFIFGEVRL
jgi:CBS domain containing-hemolysin-like protein